MFDRFYTQIGEYTVLYNTANIVFICAARNILISRVLHAVLRYTLHKSERIASPSLPMNSAKDGFTVGTETVVAIHGLHSKWHTLRFS